MITHVTGPSVTVNDRWLRQRCAWCGELLVSYDFELTAVATVMRGAEAITSTGERPGGFEERVFLVVDGNLKYALDPDYLVDPHGYPDDACLNER